MYLGFNSMNNPNDPEPAQLAKTLEQAGFESLWYGEHSHIPRCRTTPYPAGDELPDPYKKMMDPYISLMAAASVTSSLKIGTGISLLMERELISQAKTIVTLDRLSKGRLIIGAGVGWNEEEFLNANKHIPFRKRYRGLKETIAATRALLQDESPEFHGEFINFDPVWFEPKPHSEAGPKFLLGAMGPLGIQHAAEWADGWMPADVALPDVKQSIDAFHEKVKSYGRNPDDIEITIVAMMDPEPDDLKRYRDLGINRVLVGVGVNNWDKPEVITPMIEKFSKVIPEIR